jgi:hypothetical protein
MLTPPSNLVAFENGRKMNIEFTKEWVDSIPKTINSNKCWIPKIGHNSGGDRYIAISSNGIRYMLHRLVVSIYYNLNYHDQSWTARHNTGCDGTCFYIEHLKSGTNSDNVKDSVRDKTHNNASKKVCPKCGSEYKINIVKTGLHRGEIRRICRVCVSISKIEWKRRQIQPD